MSALIINSKAPSDPSEIRPAFGSRPLPRGGKSTQLLPNLNPYREGEFGAQLVPHAGSLDSGFYHRSFIFHHTIPYHLISKSPHKLSHHGKTQQNRIHLMMPRHKIQYHATYHITPRHITTHNLIPHHTLPSCITPILYR